MDQRQEVSSKLAVLLHADVVDSTALVREDEARAHRRIRDCFERFAEIIGAHDGAAREIRGDALVAEFSRASDALSAAWSFQQANMALVAECDDDACPRVRVGIAAGEVVIADGTVTGEGIVLAQRLEQLAGEHGICLHDAVRQILPARLPFAFEDLGEQMVKGFDLPVRAYRVKSKQPASSNVLARPPADAPLTQPDKPSIVVLPFLNLSADADQEYFSDGITEDILTALSYFSGLFVIARNSSFAYQGQAVDPRQVSADLGVRYLLEGSVRRMGPRIRITSQLIDAVSGGHLWAEKFDGDVAAIFDLQDEITRKIVGSIAPRIDLAEVERSRGLNSAQLSSYELSLRAKSQFYDAIRSGDSEGMERTLDTAQQSLELDPRNVHALWIDGLARIEQHLYRWGKDPDGALERAADAAEQLVHVDAADANGHALRASVHMFRHEFEDAIADFRRALSLNPNSAVHLFLAAWGESLAGHFDAAREHVDLGLRLSPREMDLWLGVAYLALTQASFAEQNYDEARKWGRLAIQMHTTAPIRRALMIAICAFAGDHEEAQKQAQRLEEFAPNFVRSLLKGSLALYKHQEHNDLLLQGLREAGFGD
jgi:TolB-like protein